LNRDLRGRRHHPHRAPGQGRALPAAHVTAQEIELGAGRPESLAGRWAAKEAVLKALGVGIGEVPLTDIEIAAEGTRPVVRLQAAAAELAGTAGLTDWQVTISHDGDYAVAFVVATGVSLET